MCVKGQSFSTGVGKHQVSFAAGYLMAPEAERDRRWHRGRAIWHPVNVNLAYGFGKLLCMVNSGDKELSREFGDTGRVQAETLLLYHNLSPFLSQSQCLRHRKTGGLS